MTVALRTSAGNTIANSLRQAVRAVDPDQPIFKLQPIVDTMSEGLAQPRFEMALLGTFAGMALLLAAVGIYGLMAYWVAQRTPELGIRMALGAQRAAVLRLVLRQGFTLAMCGVAAGIIASLALNRVLSTLLFGVTTTDPATFAATSLLLMAVAMIAVWLPARRATRIDPLVALRYE
jgi:putative ABC transport system permease protein